MNERAQVSSSKKFSPMVEGRDDGADPTLHDVLYGAPKSGYMLSRNYPYTRCKMCREQASIFIPFSIYQYATLCSLIEIAVLKNIEDRLHDVTVQNYVDHVEMEIEAQGKQLPTPLCSPPPQGAECKMENEICRGSLGIAFPFCIPQAEVRSR